MRNKLFTTGWHFRNDLSTTADIHVVPIDDLVPHTEARDCPCHPSEDPEYPRVVMHHSADGREHYEEMRPQ